MNLKRTVASSLIVAITTLSLPIGPAFAEAGERDVIKVRGTVLQQQSDGWGPVSSSVSSGVWIRTQADSEITLQLAGAVVRATPGSEFRIDRARSGASEMTLKQGRLLARVPEGTHLAVKAGDAVATSDAGEFVLDVRTGQPKLHVFEGGARLTGAPKASTSPSGILSGWLLPEVALLGPDIRSRTEAPEEFVTPEEETGGEDVEPPVAPSPPPPPPPPPPPEVNILEQVGLAEGGGFTPPGAPILLGVLGGLGLIGLIIAIIGDEDEDQDVPIVVSP